MKGGCHGAGGGHINYLGQAFAYRREASQLAIYVLAARLHTAPHAPLGHPLTRGEPGFTSKPSGRLHWCRSRRRPDRDLDTRGVKLFGKDRWGTRLLGPWDRWGTERGIQEQNVALGVIAPRLSLNACQMAIPMWPQRAKSLWPPSRAHRQCLGTRIDCDRVSDKLHRHAQTIRRLLGSVFLGQLAWVWYQHLIRCGARRIDMCAVGRRRTRCHSL